MNGGPNITSLSVIGLGSPMSDNLTIGFDPRFTGPQRTAVFSEMLSALRRTAGERRCQLLAVKSIDGLAREMDDALNEHDFNCVTSVPLVMLDLPFTSLEAYFNSLPSKTASYLRRKYRTASDLRMQHIDDISGYETEIYRLFRSTLEQSSVSYGNFQELHEDYFANVVRGLGSNAKVILAWHGAQLVGFQFFIVSNRRIVAKQIGMAYPVARKLNLYFVSWIELIKYAISMRVPTIEMGATTYATKLLFGGYLERRSLFYRFRRDISNRLLHPMAPMFDFEGNDPELKQLSPRHLQNMRGI